MVHDRYQRKTLKKHVEDILINMSTNIELFEISLYSHPSCLCAVSNANDRHTDY